MDEFRETDRALLVHMELPVYRNFSWKKELRRIRKLLPDRTAVLMAIMKLAVKHALVCKIAKHLVDPKANRTMIDDDFDGNTKID